MVRSHVDPSVFALCAICAPSGTFIQMPWNSFQQFAGICLWFRHLLRLVLIVGNITSLHSEASCTYRAISFVPWVFIRAFCLKRIRTANRKAPFLRHRQSPSRSRPGPDNSHHVFVTSEQHMYQKQSVLTVRQSYVRQVPQQHSMRYIANMEVESIFYLNHREQYT